MTMFGDNDPLRSPIGCLNPIVKLSAVVVFGLSALIWPNPFLGVILILVLALVAASARMGVRFWKLMLGFGVPAAAMLLLIQGMYSPDNRTFIIDLGFARLGLEGTVKALNIVVVLLVFLGSFTIVNQTTSPGKLIAALTARGFSAKIGYLVLASLNVIPQMQRRLHTIRAAQEARGLETDGSIICRMRATIPLLGPVVMSSLTDAQERGMTLETRGFSIGGKQTSFIKDEWHTVDRILLIGLGVYLVFVVIVSICVRVGAMALPEVLG